MFKMKIHKSKIQDLYKHKNDSIISQQNHHFHAKIKLSFSQNIFLNHHQNCLTYIQMEIHSIYQSYVSIARYIIQLVQIIQLLINYRMQANKHRQNHFSSFAECSMVREPTLSHHSCLIFLVRTRCSSSQNAEIHILGTKRESL